MKWSLKELYNGFDSKEYLEDFKNLDEKIEAYSNWANENLETMDNSVEKIEEYIKSTIDLSKSFSKLMSFANLTNTVEAKNEESLQYLDKLSVKSTLLTKPNVQFKKFVKNIDNLDELINSSPLLKEHEFFLNQVKKESKYMLSEKEEVLISKMSNTGSRAWSSLQNMLASTLLVDIEIDGEEKQLPLPVVRNMAYDNDPILRKKAYEAEQESYRKIEESSAASLNGIKGEVITTSQLRGFESPLEET